MMCGIFGYTGFKREKIKASQKALHTLSHRGPDQWGDWYDEDVYIGHQRLSILDTSEDGRQPMVNVNKEVVMSVNGEIYNYMELKKDLQVRYRFRSNSDSEVLLHGYTAWGIEGLLKRIDGMFAFCIYDISKRKLFFARDHIGIKPLYYAHINNCLAWASELKAIESFFGKENLQVNSSSLYDFLTYLYIPTPKTMYCNVYKLEPAHYLEVDISTNRFDKYCYWKLNTQEQKITLDDAIFHLKELIQKSVGEQLMSDVPIGVFLSGGMDSSTIVAEASKFTKKMNTYSIGFDIPEHNETRYAQIVANQFHTNHESRILDQAYGKRLFQNLTEWFDEPFADTSALPTYFVSELAKKTSTVVLTGDGGDEIFGGYQWYFKYNKLVQRRLQSLSLFKPLISKIKRKYRNNVLGKVADRVEYTLLLDDLELYAKVRGRMLKGEKCKYARLLDIPDDYDDYWYYRKFYRYDLPLLSRLQYLDFHTYLPDQILTKVDRVSMAVSLEARVPLLSKKIIEFSFSVPEELSYYDNRLKGLLKFAYKDILPNEILNRAKKGFSVPLGKWDRMFVADKDARQKLILEKQFNLNTQLS